MAGPGSIPVREWRTGVRAPLGPEPPPQPRHNGPCREALTNRSCRIRNVRACLGNRQGHQYLATTVNRGMDCRWRARRTELSRRMLHDRIVYRQRAHPSAVSCPSVIPSIAVRPTRPSLEQTGTLGPHSADEEGGDRDRHRCRPWSGSRDPSLPAKATEIG
jgi:hypothetical protein